MNTKLMSLGLSVATVLMMSACGTTDDSDDSSGGGTNNPSTVQPAAAYTCEKTLSFNGKSITMKAGANGDLKIVCNEFGGDLKFNNVNEIAIAQLVSTETVNFVEVSGDTINATVNTDLKAGTRTYKGTSSAHGNINCVETYDTGTLPVTIYDASDLETYIEFDNMQQTNTTCPDWINEDDSNSPDPKSAEIQSNATVTDVNGKKSNASAYSKF